MSNLQGHFSGEGEIPDWLTDLLVSSDSDSVTQIFDDAALSRKLGEDVSLLRQSTGKNITVFAPEVGLSRGHLSKLENGRGNPTISTLGAIAKAGGKTLQISYIDQDEKDNARLTSIFHDADVSETLGSAVSQLRQSTGKSITAIAPEVGLSRGHLSKLENGHGNATINTLAAIAQKAGKTIEVTFVDQEPDVL